MKIVCYTAIFGDIKDRLRRPQHQEGNKVEFVAFSDVTKTHKLTGWEIRPPVWELKDKRRQARKHKCLPHLLFPDAEMTIWIDGCLTPTRDLRELVEKTLHRHDLAVFNHMERSCVYQELEACLRLKKDNPDLMKKQIASYMKAGYPRDHGLGETTAVLRRHTEKIIAFNARWWQEICKFSKRDQLSFDYLCWDMGIEYACLKGKRIKSPYFSWVSHR